MHLAPQIDLVWVEFDLEGKELGRWPVSGELIRMPPIFVSGRTYMWTATGIVTLDRAAGQWTPTPIPTEGTLVGTENEALVFADRHGNTLHWIAVNGR
jgi:hypothetical protein